MTDELAAKIRERAYQIWERENRPDGKDLEHWLRAGVEIEAERSRAPDQAEHGCAGQPASAVAETADPTPKVAGVAKRKIE
ncbi:MAG: hypothetical protein BroJett029_04880 [Alphaproteobacteria bacterium]|jgi:hypothetical protein|nr:MAG: hypothetical protein BroJett029_04880 [Alphaproteobacteria bacterium]